MTGRPPAVELRRAPLEPVTPLPLPSRRWIRWMLLALAAVAAVVVVGVRRDWPEALRSGHAWWHSMLLVAAAGSGAWAALRLAVPGEARPSATIWPLAIAGAWVGSVGLEFGTGPASLDLAAIGFGWRCVVRAMVGAAVPGVSLLYLVRKAWPIEARATAIALATATVAAGELAAEWMCPNMRAMHLLAWHVVPLIIVIGLAALGPWLARYLVDRHIDGGHTAGVPQ